MTDHYAVLGVSPLATPEEIKSAYRRLVRACHPDVQGSPASRERFAQVQAAYEVLGDAQRRAAYDPQRQAWMDSEGLVECPHCRANNRMLRSPGAGATVRCGRCKATLLMPVGNTGAPRALAAQWEALYDEVGSQMAALAADGIRSGVDYVRSRISRLWTARLRSENT